jgi:target of rapamycin complex subunit LST8
MGSQVVLCTAGYDHTIRFWEATSGICYRSLPHAESQVNALDISPDKALLAAAGNPAIRVYEVASSSSGPLASYDGHAGNVVAVGFQKDAKWLYSGSEDGTVRLWDLRAPGCAREYASRAPVTTVALHPNQGELVSGDAAGNVRVWDLTAGACSCELVPEVGTAVRSLSVALDGSLLVAANSAGTCYVWRAAARPGGGGGGGGVTAVSEPGTPGGGAGDATTTTTGGPPVAVGVGPTGAGGGATTHFEPLHKLRAHPGKYILKCLLSPDVRALATTSSDRTVKLWSLDGFGLDRTLTGHGRWVWDAVFSVDGAYLVTASSDGTARLWDLASGDAIRVYSGHHKAVVACALNDSAIDGHGE